MRDSLKFSVPTSSEHPAAMKAIESAVSVTQEYQMDESAAND